MLSAADIRALRGLCPNRLHVDVPLGRISRWRVGGKADVVVRPRGVAQLSALIRLCLERRLPYVVVGATSNLLFADEGLRALCIQVQGDTSDIAVRGNEIDVGAGVWGPYLTLSAMHAGLTGIEHLCGVPGSVGGLIYMNAGSQRKSIGNALVRVVSVDGNGAVMHRDAADCGFTTRHSVFHGNREIISGATLRLAPGARDTIRREMMSIMAARRAKFPLRFPNCGSVFVSNPAMYERWGPPGAVIEQAGLKGFRIGGAVVSRLHANFIVNAGGATAADILAVMRHVRSVVHQRTGHLLQPEVRFVEPSGQIGSALDADAYAA
ncbi:UDP-N-acetylmuramate dehydrogenase [Emcibacter sp. SYSU 3D8]|uniref:UDP-N-acetylmuramate dehydrogenase n=1 Tax=Emcibacter sp. SYSU 3D8 TaxID=3133969 RepID=UPI0031FEAF5E